jgi:hypothetical protein
VNREQELVIGGYIPGPHGFDSLIVGYYHGEDLLYVARSATALFRPHADRFLVANRLYSRWRNWKSQPN